MFTDSVYKWLETALDFGIPESDFWNMTIAELDRAFASKSRLAKIEQQKQASFDYLLADLIGRSVARIYNSANKLPPIQEVYTTLFDDAEFAEKVQEKKDELSTLRLKLFAQSFNSKFNEGVADN